MFRDHVQFSFFEYYILVCLRYSFGSAGRYFYAQNFDDCKKSS